jgi:hypothetical protein
MQEYEKLREMADSCQGDVEKAAAGNKAAGTRVRKAMQEIKAQAQEVRKAVLIKTKKE